jgi:hypothetical protein
MPLHDYAAVEREKKVSITFLPSRWKPAMWMKRLDLPESKQTEQDNHVEHQRSEGLKMQAECTKSFLLARRKPA